MDSLRLQDLNLGCATRAAPALSRIASVTSIKTADLSRAHSMVQTVQLMQSSESQDDNLSYREGQVPPPSREQAVVGKARERQLTHQMSLECISSAIASATARRQGHQRTQSSLRSIASSAEIETWEEPTSATRQQAYRWSDEMEYEDEHGPRPLQLDDLEDVPDAIAEFDLEIDAANDLHKIMMESPLVTHEDGVDDDECEDFGSDLELNVMMQSKFSDDEEDLEEQDDSMRSRSLRRGSVLSEKQVSTLQDVPDAASENGRQSSSPVKPEQIPKSAMRRSDRFAFATPTSPVKANIDLPVPRSPMRSNATSPSLDVKTTRRPLPPRPDASPSFSSPTKASLAKDTSTRAELTKKSSMTSLKRQPGVARRASSKSLASEAAVSDCSRPASPTKPSPNLQGAQRGLRSPLPAKSPRASPTISVTASSPVAASASPRKIKVAPVTSLRSAKSMHELRAGPMPQAPQRKPTMVPSVRTKIAALETRQATLQRLTSVHARVAGGASDLNRANSTASSVSEVSFAGLQRVDSLASFKAPLLRRKVHDPMP